MTDRIAQIMEVLDLVRAHFQPGRDDERAVERLRIDATVEVAKRLQVHRETVTDKYGRRLGPEIASVPQFDAAVWAYLGQGSPDALLGALRTHAGDRQDIDRIEAFFRPAAAGNVGDGHSDEQPGGQPAETSPPTDRPQSPGSSPTLPELVRAYERSFQERVLAFLAAMTPSQFEEFAGRLLSAYGFMNVEVTGRAGDGGVDGHGQLRIGLALMDVAFQCKRWRGNVGSAEVDAFRGSIQGKFEQGIMFAASGFTKSAKDKSIQKGAAPIILLDGSAIVDLMARAELYVRRRPLYWYDLETGQ